MTHGLLHRIVMALLCHQPRIGAADQRRLLNPLSLLDLGVSLALLQKLGITRHSSSLTKAMHCWISTPMLMLLRQIRTSPSPLQKPPAP